MQSLSRRPPGELNMGERDGVDERRLEKLSECTFSEQRITFIVV
jgi:hypothetical protein